MPNQYEPILEEIRNSDLNVMLDVGIRDGGEWDYFHEHMPELKLLSTEPDARLRLQFLEQHPQEEVHPYAVWSVPCEKTLVTSTQMCPSLQFEGKGPLVSCVTLDWLVTEFTKSEDRIFLWIDIEGSELEAFKGATELLSSKRVRYIYTELRTSAAKRSETWCTDTEIVAFLRKFGYCQVFTQQLPQYTHYDALFELKD